MKNTIAFILSVVVAAVPQLMDTFAEFPKVKAALSIVGVVMAAVLVQLGKLPEQKKDAGYVRIGVLCTLASFGAFVGFLLTAVTMNGCATTNKFTNVVVDCSEDTIAKYPTVASNVRQCLTGVVSGGYAQCLQLLPFAVSDVVCIVQEYSRGTAKAINGGDADPQLAVINRNANAWLKENNVSRK